jgi:type VI protein secretion system component VasK
MWRHKKLILMATLAIVVLGGAIGGVALAQNEDTNQSQTTDRQAALLDKVGSIYEQNTGVALDLDQLKTAFTQAQSEMLTEAEQARLQALVDEKVITQDQADEYLNWLQSRPDVPLGGPGGLCERGFGGHGFGGMWR